MELQKKEEEEEEGRERKRARESVANYFRSLFLSNSQNAT